ncbi:uncharacterized protein LOC112600469 [Melanaphis sacchari]|uniref:uncharacterized protein LOC112600469 n=1 Tax=Melanaphis sacchari TaxID=742174 RepID=UPI000DC1537C|nr:uncharacterized protein LOC112600469 [Melanaphis sacchari]
MDKSFEEKLKRGRLLIKHLEELQYSYFNARPEWLTIQKNELKLFMACLYYDYPSRDKIELKSCSDINNADKLFILYGNEIQKKILNMTKKVEELIELDSCNNIKVGVTITHSICKTKCNVCQNFPDEDIHKWTILRLKSIKSKCIFIDFERNRTYSDWEEYLNNNNLPEGYMFYPISGFYDASKSLYQNITPASKQIEKILKTTDLAAHFLNWVGCITLGAGLIFPLAMPITLTTYGILTISSMYQGGREINQLINIYKYENEISATQCSQAWINVAIAAVGSIAGPFHAYATVTSEVQTTGRTLNIFRRSAYITQCTLEVFRFTLNTINNNFEITPINVLYLSLDLFMATGILMSSIDIKEILKILPLQAAWMPIYKTLEKIPYCFAQQIWNCSVYFFKHHLIVFVERITMFLGNNLTVHNLLFAWQMIQRVFDIYQKQTAKLDVDNLLWHLVDNIAEKESVKFVLRGQRMVKLLESLPEDMANGLNRRSLFKYCVDHVLLEAKKLSELRDSCMAELTRLGENRASELDRQFCAMYGLESCSMDQYVLWAIEEVGKHTVTLMAEYQEYMSRPENMFNNEMVVNETGGAGPSVKGFTLNLPCSVLDVEMCLQIVGKINPQYDCTNHKFVQPEPDASLLIKFSAYSIDIVFFGIDLINGVPSMNICFFKENNDSAMFVNNCKSLKKLQIAH